MRRALLFLALGAAVAYGGDVVRVRVVAFDGEPVAGARLEVRPSFADTFDPVWPGCTAATAEAWWKVTPAGAGDTLLSTATTDADGWATIGALPEGAFDVVAYAAGRAVRGAQVLSPPVRGAPPPTIVLDAGHAIEGRVTSEGGAPIARALVAASYPSAGTARWEDRERSLLARTDDKGSFRLDGVPAGTVVLRACPAGSWSDRQHIVHVPMNGPVEITVEIHAIEAIVLDDRTGEPIPAADVYFETAGLDISWALAHGTTDAKGILRLAYPSHALGPVEIHAPGYLRRLSPSPGDSLFDLASVAGQRLVFRAAPAAPLRGTVRDATGPVASATVTATWLDGFETASLTAVTGADGAFDLAAPAGLVHLAATRPGLATEEELDLDVLLATGKDGGKGLVAVPAAGRDGIRLEIPARPGVGRVSGRVVTAQGAPVVTDVGVMNAGKANDTKSSADGSFEIEGVPAGEVRLVAVASRSSKATSEPIRIQAGTTVQAGDIVIEGGATVRVEGHVVGLDRHPDAVAQDLHSSRRYPVAADGTFSFFASSGLVGVEVVARDGWIARGEAKAKEGARVALGDLKLEEPLMRVFQVIDAEKDAPIRDATVKLYLPPTVIACGPCEPAIDHGTRADDGGWFRVAIPPGDGWEIQVRAPGFSGRNLPADRIGDHVDLRRPVAIAGRVRFGDGQPAARVCVRTSVPWDSGEPHDDHEALTDGEGRFRIEGLAAARLEVTVESAADGPSIVECWSDATAPSEALEFVVEHARTIEGRVVDARGRPVARAEVSAEMVGEDTSPTLRAVTDGAGLFRLAGARAGKYDLVVSSDGIHDNGKAEGVAAGATGVTVRAEIGYRIAGRVVDGEGRPRVGWVVNANNDLSHGEHRARTDADGRFVIDELEGGRWDLKLGQWCHRDPDGGKAVAAGTEDIVLVLR